MFGLKIEKYLISKTGVLILVLITGRSYGAFLLFLYLFYKQIAPTVLL